MRRPGPVLLLAFAVRAGAQGGEELAALREKLRPERPRGEHLEALGKLESSPATSLAVAKELVFLATDEDLEVSRRARQVLVGLGKAAWPELASAGSYPRGRTHDDEALADLLVSYGEEVIPAIVEGMGAFGVVEPGSADARALQRFGAKAVPVLERMVRDRSPGLGPFGPRRATLRVLGLLGPTAEPALPALREALADATWDRADLALAIARITPDAEERRRMLLAALVADDSPADDLLDEMARCGPRMKEAVPRLWQIVQEGDASRIRALRALLSIDGDVGAVLPYLVRALVVPPDPLSPWAGDADIVDAVELLKEMGASARPASDALLELLARDDYPRSEMALRAALHGIGVDPALLPRLRGWLRKGRRRAVLVTLEALGWMGPEAAAALPDVARLLEHEDERIRRKAQTWLQECELPPASVSLGLGEALDGADEDLACTLLDRLRELGPEAKGAVPAIRRACADPGGRALVRAMLVCVHIGPEAAAAVPEAVAALESGIQGAPWAGASALIAFGERARPAIPDLKRIMGNRPSSSGLWAANALVAISPESAAEVARYAASCLKDPELSALALWALSVTGDAARRYLDRARPLLGAKDAPTRAAAAHLLASRNVSVPAALRTLGDLLRPDGAEAVTDACEAIERLGPAARPLEAALKKLRAEAKLDDDERAAVERALQALAAKR